MVSVKVEFSHFKRTKQWFLSHGIEVQGHLNTIEEESRILKNSPQGSFLLSVAQIVSLLEKRETKVSSLCVANACLQEQCWYR